jgi:hypothetical protein
LLGDLGTTRAESPEPSLINDAKVSKLCLNPVIPSFARISALETDLGTIDLKVIGATGAVADWVEESDSSFDLNRFES